MVNGMEMLGAKVPDDLSERIEEYREDHGMNTSQAVRQLIRAGLDREDNPNTISLPLALLWFGTVAVATQYASASGIVGPLGVACTVLGAALLNSRLRQTVNDARARFTGRQDTSDDDSG